MSRGLGDVYKRQALGGAENILTTVIGIAAGINAPIELVVCAVLGSAIGKGLSVGLKKI